MQRIAVLGSTGSIGRQTLDVARRHGLWPVVLTAGKNARMLLAQAAEFRPELVVCSEEVAAEVRGGLPPGVRLLTGAQALIEAATYEVDSVVAAIPGMASLAPTAAALRAGRHVALASKEAMVVAGPLMRQLVATGGGAITPVDSEHSALFQCLLGEAAAEVAALVLTASGGPFLSGPADLAGVTPAQALAHPNWAMGAKVTIDSATLFNKGLEVLEAHFLFDLPLEQIEVVVHPESLVHGLVRFTDGSIKAQVGPHDMRLPIQYALLGPRRPASGLAPLPLAGRWTFLEPDTGRFPSLALAYQAGHNGGVAPAYLNAADEVAVSAFLAGEIGFNQIPMILEQVLAAAPPTTLSWGELELADHEARRLASQAATALGQGRTR